MSIVYVERRSGVVVTVASLKQETATEAIDDQHPDVVAFRASIAAVRGNEATKQTSFRAKVDQAITDMATYKATTNRTTAQRDAWENKVCDLLIVMLKRSTQQD